MGAQPAYPEERDERHYRYSVKCDRVFAHRIARAARAAGLSETSFVQAHFDRILEARPAPAAAGAGSAADPMALSRRHGIPPFSARVLIVLAARAGAGREVALSATQIAEAMAAQHSVEQVRKGLRTLQGVGLVELASPAGGRRVPVWRVAEGAA